MEPVTLLLHILHFFILLRLGKLGLFDCTIGDSVVTLQLGQSLIEGLLLCDQDLASVVASVHLALQAIDKKENHKG